MCSKRCRGDRKKSNRIVRGAAMFAGDDLVELEEVRKRSGAVLSDDPMVLSDDRISDDEVPASSSDAAKATRKAARAATKAERRAKREGSLPGVGQKASDLRERRVDLPTKNNQETKVNY